MARTRRLVWMPLLALALLAAAPAASAHEQFTAGKYRIEVGWQYEPPVVDQPNAVTITVTDMSGGGDGVKVTDGVTLTPVLSLGSAEATLSLDTSDDTPGEYFGAVVPTQEGDYAVHITGNVAGVQVDHTTKLQTVDPPSKNGFPVAHGTVRELQDRVDGLQTLLWAMSGIAAVLAVLALALAIKALKRGGKPAPAAPRPAAPPMYAPPASGQRRPPTPPGRT